MQTPKQYYQSLLGSGRFECNLEQEAIIDYLDQLFVELQPRFSAPRLWGKVLNAFSFYLSKFIFKKKSVKGLYLYGGVGIGKTWLMDIFYSCLPPHHRFRMHFHRFMRQMHLELKQLQGEKNPLQLIAKRIAKQTPVLCFDEFFVLDIADAMILYGVMKNLFEQGVTLVTTSNAHPDDLYKHGISRENFVPAIQLIKKHARVIFLPSLQDYRMRILAKEGAYYCPLTEANAALMAKRFNEMAGDREVFEHQDLIIEARAIRAQKLSHGIAWFKFNDLCSTPRSQIDYLDLARSYHTIFLSDVPQILAKQHHAIFYLINLVDIFYDNQTKLILSAEVSIDELYLEGPMRFEFQRTRSRLHEMQTSAYWQKAHLGQ